MATIISSKTSGVGGLAVTGDSSGILQLASADGTTAVTIDASQNVGIGVIPSAWSGDKAIQIGTCGAISAGSGTTAMYMLSNAYYNSGYKYIANGLPASGYYQYNGGHAWESAPSGSVGTAISFTQTMTLDSSGNLGIGTSSAGGKLGIVTSTTATALNCNNALDTGFQVNFVSGLTSIGNNFNNPLAFLTSNTERMRIDASGNVFVGGTTQNTSTAPVYSSTTAKAWANFAGAVTPTINASFNVSSITYISTGIYQLNFTNALVDAKYVVTGCGSSNGATVNLLMPLPAGASKTTGLVTVSIFTIAGAATATTEVNVAIFR